MHAVLALVIKHDRYLSGVPWEEPTASEIYHGYQAASLLNRKLSGSLNGEDRDAIGAVGILLGALALASTDANTPEKAWPLKLQAPDDLQWLKLSGGKKELWKVVNPFRPESCFRPFIYEFTAISNATDQTGLAVGKFPPHLLELCGLNVVSNPENNPYFRAVQILAQLQGLKCNHVNCLSFFAFVNDMHPVFRTLLEFKDPRALLLLAFWYAKVSHYQWWIAYRATIECRAICIYLETHYAHDVRMQELLQFPRNEMCSRSTANVG